MCRMEFSTDRTFLKNWLICRLTICWKFMTCAICQNIIFNNANVVFTTDRQYWSERMSKGLRAKRTPSKASTEQSEHRATLQSRGRRRFPLVTTFLANREIFGRSVKNSLFCWQIVIWHIALWQIAMHPNCLSLLLFLFLNWKNTFYSVRFIL